MFANKSYFSDFSFQKHSMTFRVIACNPLSFILLYLLCFLSRILIEKWEIKLDLISPDRCKENDINLQVLKCEYTSLRNKICNSVISLLPEIGVTEKILHS